MTPEISITGKPKVTRKTPQRMKILEYLRSVRTHPTAEEVYNAVKKEMPSITLATVYRNLNLMADQGQIIRLEIDHEYRYDAHSEGHIHFVCKNTGRIIDIDDDEVAEYVKSKLGKGFNPEKVTVIVKGTYEVK